MRVSTKAKAMAFNRPDFDSRDVSPLVAYERFRKTYFNYAAEKEIRLPYKPYDIHHALKFVLLGPQRVEDAIQLIQEFPVEEPDLTLTVTLEDTMGLRVVETTEEDIIFWAKRPGKKDYSRFVKWEGDLLTTRDLTMCLTPAKKMPDLWYLLTAYPGQHIPRECEARNNPVAREFWKNHAHIADLRIIDRETILSDDVYQQLHGTRR
jgi:hypothetical protein